MPFVAVDQVANTNVLRLQGAPAGHFPTSYELPLIQHELGLTNIDFGFKGDNRYESNTVGFKYIGWAINFLQLRLF